MPSPDAIRLRHVRQAVASALELAAGSQRSDLTSNMMLAMALARCLEILGEAASKVSPEARLRFSAIPFAKMVSMRNHLIHAYLDIDLDIVWTTVTDDLPSLLPVLDSALAEGDA
jgi:uncharacterized protein with HEPN domain